MPNTDIEELRLQLLDHFNNTMPVTVDRDYAEFLLDNLIKQKVIEARIDELEAISVSTIRQSAKSGRIGEWITIDERVERLQAQLNHNKKG